MDLFSKNPNEELYTGGKKHFADVIKNTGPGELLIWLNGEEDFNTNSTLIVATPSFLACVMPLLVGSAHLTVKCTSLEKRTPLSCIGEQIRQYKCVTPAFRSLQVYKPEVRILFR